MSSEGARRGAGRCGGVRSGAEREDTLRKHCCCCCCLFSISILISPTFLSVPDYKEGGVLAEAKRSEPNRNLFAARYALSTKIATTTTTTATRTTITTTPPPPSSTIAVGNFPHLFFQELSENSDGSFQVGLVERIPDIPTQRPELSSFL